MLELQGSIGRAERLQSHIVTAFVYHTVYLTCTFVASVRDERASERLCDSVVTGRFRAWTQDWNWCQVDVMPIQHINHKLPLPITRTVSSEKLTEP